VPNSQQQNPATETPEDPLNPKCRYEEATDDVYDLINHAINTLPEFSSLVNVKIMAIFDLKKKLTKGQLRLAEVKLTNDMTRYLTIDFMEDRPEGYDVIMVIDKLAWQLTYKMDPDQTNTIAGITGHEYRRRLVRHELRHIMLDVDANKARILPHDVEDFMAEVKLNTLKPDWAITLAESALSYYEAMKGV